MGRCHRACLHRRLVMDYRIERERRLGEQEGRTGGYATELAEDGPVLTFKQWLEDHANPDN